MSSSRLFKKGAPRGVGVCPMAPSQAIRPGRVLQRAWKHRSADGFSLVEVMIVIVIIGLLAGLVAVNVRSYLTKARQNAARKDIAVIAEALDLFWAEHYRYPTNEEGLTLLARPADRSAEALLKDVPIDPWKRPYQYNSPGATGPYEVLCLGADGKEGGTGADADITSDDLRGEPAP